MELLLEFTSTTYSTTVSGTYTLTITSPVLDVHLHLILW